MWLCRPSQLQKHTVEEALHLTGDMDRMERGEEREREGERKGQRPAIT
jgi:hypothetical protein